MNIGWIFLSCALVILVIMAFAPWRRKERTSTMESQYFSSSGNFLARLDEFDARLVRRDEVVSLLHAGQKINAIKVYREDTGASLADAKAAVERMEMALKLGVSPQAQNISEEIESVAGGSLNGEVERLLSQGKKIQAIKLYREQTGVGLREAKEAIDLMEQA